MSFKGDRILKCKYYSAGATGSGDSADSPAPFSDADIMAILAGTVIEGVDVVVTTAITGSSPQVNIGDDDDQNGFAADADVTEGTPGVYAGAGAYLASGAKKHYASEGKEVKADFGGTLSAGACCVVVKGYRI